MTKYLDDRKPWNKSVDSPIVAGAEEWYAESRPPYICDQCHHTLIKLQDRSGLSISWFCNNCKVEYDPGKQLSLSHAVHSNRCKIEVSGLLIIQRRDGGRSLIRMTDDEYKRPQFGCYSNPYEPPISIFISEDELSEYEHVIESRKSYMCTQCHRTLNKLADNKLEEKPQTAWYCSNCDVELLDEEAWLDTCTRCYTALKLIDKSRNPQTIWYCNSCNREFSEEELSELIERGIRDSKRISYDNT